MNYSMNDAVSTDTAAASAIKRVDADALLVREAGLPFQPSLVDASGIDSIAEWLSLMEVVQMLCPVWPVRDRAMQGDHWRI
jgi:hypothetical protein